jgi:hypothetical protein
MAYCPECQDEFEDWVEVCPDCKIALVRELPAKPDSNRTDDPLVHIATASSEPLAMFWKGVLENEGIHSLIKSRDLRAAGYLPSLLSYCEIHVLASQAEQAKQIVAPLLEDGLSIENI